MSKVIACNIEYDCTDEELVDLPKTIEIPQELLNEDDDVIADLISDTTGFCINGFTLSTD